MVIAVKHFGNMIQKAKTAEHITCRGVGYYDATQDKTLSKADLQTPSIQACPQRILTSTVDGRLIALNAKTGALCPQFGVNGQVDLLNDMGPTEKVNVTIQPLPH